MDSAVDTSTLLKTILLLLPGGFEFNFLSVVTEFPVSDIGSLFGVDMKE